MSTVVEKSLSPASSTAAAYERFRPLIVWLGVGEVAWISGWLLSSSAGSAALQTATLLWIALMAAWMSLVIRLSRQDVFLNGSRWLSNHFGFSLVLLIAAGVFGTVANVRAGLFAAATAASDSALIAIHLLRVLAIGTAIKFWQRQLPRHFFLLGTIPDFLFALSAIPMLALGGSGSLNSTTLIAWHAIGSAVFLGAAASMYFTMPSPLRLFHSTPDTRLVFQFPMVLAPNFTVPLFVVAHLFAILKYAGSP